VFYLWTSVLRATMIRASRRVFVDLPLAVEATQLLHTQPLA